MHKSRILIVDDDLGVLKSVRANLEARDCKTLSAMDGAEALQVIERELPDLIILDITMPKMDGFEVCRRIREWSQIPIIMLTGVSGVLQELEEHQEETFEKPYDSLRHALKDKIKEMREVGQVKPEMFVDKPVEPESFIAKVRQLIGS